LGILYAEVPKFFPCDHLAPEYHVQVPTKTPMASTAVRLGDTWAEAQAVIYNATIVETRTFHAGDWWQSSFAITLRLSLAIDHLT
jgi:predicted aconitase